MAFDYEQYEIECTRIREANEKLLEAFGNWLRQSHLSEKTVQKHTENIDFYINDYLLYEDAIEPQDGILSVDMFLGDWFVRKTVWAGQSSLKSNAASLKKFYTYLCEQRLVDKEELKALKATIKENMPEWLDNPALTDMGDVWDF